MHLWEILGRLRVVSSYCSIFFYIKIYHNLFTFEHPSWERFTNDPKYCMLHIHRIKIHTPELPFYEIFCLKYTVQDTCFIYNHCGTFLLPSNFLFVLISRDRFPLVGLPELMFAFSWWQPEPLSTSSLKTPSSVPPASEKEIIHQTI